MTLIVLDNTYPAADAVAVVPALKAAVADFERTSATSHLHKAAVLLVCMCLQYMHY